MQLFVKIIPLRAGSAEPAGKPRIITCPPDVEPDTILSFLTQRMGEVIETMCTSTQRHERIDIGWIFPGPRAAQPQDAIEFACVPLMETNDGLQPMFEVQADRRLEFGQLAVSRGIVYKIVQQPHRAYHPSADPDISASHPRERAPRDELDHLLADIAHQAGAKMLVYPRPGPAARRIILENDRDDRGTRYQEAALGEDGTLTITGRDQGPVVSEFFGADITCYEWVYVVAPARVPALVQILAGHDGDDVVALLAAYHQQRQGQISDLMKHPDVTADFSNRHS